MSTIYATKVKRRHATASAQSRAYKAIAKAAVKLIDLYGVCDAEERIFDNAPIDSAVIAWYNLYDALYTFGIREINTGEIVTGTIKTPTPSPVPVPVPTPSPVPVPVPTPSPVPVPVPTPSPVPVSGDYVIIRPRHIYYGDTNLASAKVVDVLLSTGRLEMVGLDLVQALNQLNQFASNVSENCALVRFADSQIVQWSNSAVTPPIDSLLGYSFIHSNVHSLVNDSVYIHNGDVDAERLSAVREAFRVNGGADDGASVITWKVWTNAIGSSSNIDINVGGLYNRTNVLSGEKIPVDTAASAEFFATYQAAVDGIAALVAAGSIQVGEWLPKNRKASFGVLPFTVQVVPTEIKYALVIDGNFRKTLYGVSDEQLFGAKKVFELFSGVGEQLAIDWFAVRALDFTENVCLMRMSDLAILQWKRASVLEAVLANPESGSGLKRVSLGELGFGRSFVLASEIVTIETLSWVTANNESGTLTAAVWDVVDSLGVVTQLTARPLLNYTDTVDWLEHPAGNSQYLDFYETSESAIAAAVAVEPNAVANGWYVGPAYVRFEAVA